MEDFKIKFTVDDGTEVSFNVIEEAKLGGVNYLLVCEDLAEDDVETEAYILKEIENDKGEATYEMLEDDDELQTISDYFNSLLEDMLVTT